MTTVSKAHALKTNEARSLCIAEGKICGAKMARQPACVSAINTGWQNLYRVRVELIEIREFLERYPLFFFVSPNFQAKKKTNHETRKSHLDESTTSSEYNQEQRVSGTTERWQLTTRDPLRRGDW